MFSEAEKCPSGPGCPSTPRLCSRKCNRTDCFGASVSFRVPCFTTPTFSSFCLEVHLSKMHLHPWISLISFWTCRYIFHSILWQQVHQLCLYFFSVCFTLTFFSTVYPRFWWVFGCHSESKALETHQCWLRAPQWECRVWCADCAWVPQPPTPAPLGSAAPLGPQDQCLLPATFSVWPHPFSYLSESDFTYFPFTQRCPSLSNCSSSSSWSTAGWQTWGAPQQLQL